MVRERGDPSLHERVRSAVLRAAAAQEDSRNAIDVHASVMTALRKTLVEVRAARAGRVRRSTFAFRQDDARNRFPSG
jgi:hypothetical protein